MSLCRGHVKVPGRSRGPRAEEGRGRGEPQPGPARGGRDSCGPPEALLQHDSSSFDVSERDMEETRLLEEDADDTDGDKHTHVVVVVVIVFLQVEFVCCSFLRFGDFLLRWVAKGEGEGASWAARSRADRSHKMERRREGTNKSWTGGFLGKNSHLSTEMGRAVCFLARHLSTFNI